MTREEACSAFPHNRELWSKIQAQADAWLADVSDERWVKMDHVDRSRDAIMHGLRYNFADRRLEE